MENKCTDINNLLEKLSLEGFSGYEFVDYWDADTMAVGMKKGMFSSIFLHMTILKPMAMM